MSATNEKLLALMAKVESLRGDLQLQSLLEGMGFFALLQTLLEPSKRISARTRAMFQGA